MFDAEMRHDPARDFEKDDGLLVVLLTLVEFDSQTTNRKIDFSSSAFLRFIDQSEHRCSDGGRRKRRKKKKKCSLRSITA